jgi:alkaline phosphatase
VYDVNLTTRHVEPSTDANGVPYTALVCGNGPGYRAAGRTDPRTDPFPGRGGAVTDGPAHQAYFQESAVPLGSETHSAEEVAIYAIGPGSEWDDTTTLEMPARRFPDYASLDLADASDHRD